jgi:hypothetical protein
MTLGAESHETGRLPGEDELSNKTSVIISPAEGPSTREPRARCVEEELGNPESTIAVDPNLAEAMREVVTKYIKESEDMKNRR